MQVAIEPALAGEPFDVHALTAGLGDVLLVGHDPSFSLLLHDLTGCQARMKKGGLAAVSKGELVALLRPVRARAIAKSSVPVTMTDPATRHPSGQRSHSTAATGGRRDYRSRI